MAGEVSIRVQMGHNFWKSCSAPDIRRRLVNVKFRDCDGVLTWNRSLVLLNLSAAESFAFRA